MDLWFSEGKHQSVDFSIKVNQQLYSQKSAFQQIDIFESDAFGRFLSLDGEVMMTEKDEFIYHEMMVHVPMSVHPDVKTVLVIGGGDGGVVRELVKYNSIALIDVVEIDELVVRACEAFLPATAASFQDARVHLTFQDGLRFIRPLYDRYDLIIVDGTDPNGLGEVLFTKEFYGNCYKALRPEGILINQHESPFYQQDAIAVQKIHRKLTASFPISLVYQAHVPSYPSGHWLFGFSSKQYHPLADFKDSEGADRQLATRYYNRLLHKGAFALPTYVKELLDYVEDK